MALTHHPAAGWPLASAESLRGLASHLSTDDCSRTARNQVKGSLKSLEGLPHLRRLNLSRSKCFGSVSSLAKCPELQTVILSDTSEWCGFGWASRTRVSLVVVVGRTHVVGWWFLREGRAACEGRGASVRGVGVVQCAPHHHCRLACLCQRPFGFSFGTGAPRRYLFTTSAGLSTVHSSLASLPLSQR